MAIFREWLLAIAVLGLLVTAALDPSTRTFCLAFSVVGVGLLIRRRQHRLAKKRTEADQSAASPPQG